VSEPELLLADEPLLSLDLGYQRIVTDLLDARRRAAGTPVVFVTHDVNPVLPLVDREVGPFNGFSTRFQIVNKDPKKPAQVTIRFEGFDLNAGNAFVAKQNTLTVNGARLCFQHRDDFANCLAPGDRLPTNFVGTARLTSTQPIGVRVTAGWMITTSTPNGSISRRSESEKASTANLQAQ